MKTNGFLEAGVFRMWEVKRYPAIWGFSGKAVEKAREVKTRGQVSTLHTCVRELEQGLMNRQKDMLKHTDMRRCAGTCPTNLKCNACDKKLWNCPDCKSRNCADCVARQQHSTYGGERARARARERERRGGGGAFIDCQSQMTGDTVASREIGTGISEKSKHLLGSYFAGS